MLLPQLPHWRYLFHSEGVPPQNEKILPMSQQRQQHQNLLRQPLKNKTKQFIHLTIAMPRDVKGEILVYIRMAKKQVFVFLAFLGT